MENNIILKYKTQMTKDDIAEVTIGKSGANLKKFTGLSVFFFIIAVISVVISFNYDEPGFMKVISIILLTFTVCLLLLSYLLLRSNCKNFKYQKNLSYTYCFYEKNITVDIISDTSTTNTLLTYDQIKSVQKVNSFLKIITKSNVQYVLKEEENYQELIELLKTKVDNIKI